MIEKSGNVFDTTALYIGHGCNTKGVMGAGIAREMKERFPRNYQVYLDACRGGRFSLGDYLVDSSDTSEVWIVNFATQGNPGRNAQYGAVLDSLYHFSLVATKPFVSRVYGTTVAIPRIGCGIGGLEWEFVKDIILLVEKMVPSIEFEVWTL